MPTLQPPDPKSWRKHSPNNELAIASAASGAVHVVLVALVILVTMKLMKADSVEPVPVRGVVMVPDTPGGIMGDAGSGGGEAKVEAKDDRREHTQPRSLPEVELKRELIKASTFLPELQNDPEALRTVVQSPGYEKLK